MESLDQCRRLEVCEKARKLMFFVMSLRLSDHKLLHNIASSSSFFSIPLGFFSLFSLVFRTSNLWSLRNLTKQLFHLRFIGYETGYSQLGTTRLVGYLPSHNPRSWNNCLLLSGTREHKFHICKQPCIIFFTMLTPYQQFMVLNRASVVSAADWRSLCM